MPRSGERRGRTAYQPADDEAMRKWVAEHPSWPSKGKKIWEEAEKAAITNHSWQSMKERWRKTLMSKDSTRAGAQLQSTESKALGALAWCPGSGGLGMPGAGGLGLGACGPGPTRPGGLQGPGAGVKSGNETLCISGTETLCTVRTRGPRNH